MGYAIGIIIVLIIFGAFGIYALLDNILIELRYLNSQIEEFNIRDRNRD
jgi:hypothetical protein